MCQGRIRWDKKNGLKAYRSRLYFNNELIFISFDNNSDIFMNKVYVFMIFVDIYDKVFVKIKFIIWIDGEG